MNPMARLFSASACLPSALIPFFVGEKTNRRDLSNVAIRAEERDSDGSGTPDIRIRSENLFVIIENKFDAGMTKNQPLSYIQILKKSSAEKKLLVFLVQDHRLCPRAS
jgi:PD-(D/E)XK nuclease superfamily